MIPKKPTPAQARKIVKRCRRDPAWFIRNVLGEQPWSKQVEIIEAVRDHEDVAVKSCHSIGKDWIAARILLWFLFCNPRCAVISTAPTDRQVRGILWKEIATAYNKARWKLGGVLLKQEIQISASRWAIGFTAGSESDRFQGFHAPNALVIIDEASGVAKETYTAVDAILSCANPHRLEIGNPTDPTGEFAKSFKTAGIHKISVTAFETPNFTEFGITEQDIIDDTWEAKITAPLPAPYLNTPQWVAKRYKRWGATNPLYVSRVNAQFPEAGEDTLIPLSHIEAAQNRSLDPGDPNILGVDVARFGSNNTVIAQRRGPVVRIRKRFSKIDTMETAGHVQREIKLSKASQTMIDIVGLGAGVFDRLLELKTRGIMEFNGGNAPMEPEDFLNARGEAYWNVREAAEIGQLDLDPNDEDLAAQLADIRWKADSKGRVVIEKKEDMAKRGVQSPDDADAVSMCFGGGGEVVDLYKQAMSKV